MASQKGHLDVAEILIAAGAKVDLANNVSLDSFMIKSMRPIQYKARQHNNTTQDGPLLLFERKKSELPQVGFEPTHLCSLHECSATKLPRQLSDCGSN